MGRRNYLVEGVSGAGKTSVCDELLRRGERAVHGDRELAYQGDPATGRPLPGSSHQHHIWSVERVRSIAADTSRGRTFFCGGLRNHAALLDVFDGVFVLDVGEAVLLRRLEGRGDDEYGGTEEQRRHVLLLLRSGEDLPDGVRIDAERPLRGVVDELLRLAPPG